MSEEAVSRKRIGLVLEGGGVRGIYTAGVLDVFMEHGISFDGVIGVSAGAIHGCSFMSEQKGRSIRYYLKYGRDPRFMSFKSLVKTGDLVGVDFCYHELPDKLDIYDHEAFLKNKAEFYAVCTNLETGEAEYIRITDMRGQIDYLRASASMPFVSRIVEIDGRKYLDGGCADCIPVEAFEQMGFIRNVIVLTRDGGYRKKKSPLNPLFRLIYRKYPLFVRKFLSRHTDYNRTVQTVAEKEKRGEVFVIKPEKPLEIGRTGADPERVQAVYDRGRADAEAAMDSLKQWLKDVCI